MKYPRSPQEKVGGIVYFGRMLDKIRLMEAGELPGDLQANLGKGFDSACADFLAVDYKELRVRVADGLDDEQALAWCRETGRHPDAEQVGTWNDFMCRRGCGDDISEILARRKKESGFENRDEIRTMFQYIDADEGRQPAGFV